VGSSVKKRVLEARRNAFRELGEIVSRTGIGKSRGITESG
jgi:hypothetical protein